MDQQRTTWIAIREAHNLSIRRAMRALDFALRDAGIPREAPTHSLWNRFENGQTTIEPLILAILASNVYGVELSDIDPEAADELVSLHKAYGTAVHPHQRSRRSRWITKAALQDA